MRHMDVGCGQLAPIPVDTAGSSGMAAQEWLIDTHMSHLWGQFLTGLKSTICAASEVASIRNTWRQ